MNADDIIRYCNTLYDESECSLSKLDAAHASCSGSVVSTTTMGRISVDYMETLANKITTCQIQVHNLGEMVNASFDLPGDEQRSVTRYANSRLMELMIALSALHQEADSVQKHITFYSGIRTYVMGASVRTST